MLNKIMSLFRKKPAEVESPDDFLTVWGIIEGPMEDEDGEIFAVVKVSIDGEVSHTEMYFDDFNQAYAMVQHFDEQIEPIQIRIQR